MKTIISDLGSEYEDLLQQKCDILIHADGLYAPCRGCFFCWTHRPAECFMKDSLQRVCRAVGKADVLTIVTENLYGTYSPRVKTVLDRSIGLSTPLSVWRGKQMHHTLRYGTRDLLRVIVYGDITEAERESFIYMTERNAINYGYDRSDIVFLEDKAGLEGSLL